MMVGTQANLVMFEGAITTMRSNKYALKGD